MACGAWMVAAAVLTGGQVDRGSLNSADAHSCIVSLIHDVSVPAEDPGVLVSLEAREGLQVEQGTLLAQIKDNRVQNAKRVAEANLKVAEEEASNDVNIRYATMAAEVSKYEWESARRANATSPNTIPAVELEKLRLTWRRSVLQIEQAKMEQNVAVLTAQAREAEVDAASDDIASRQITAPINGMIVEVMPHEGEWVAPGDAVFRIVQLDRLRVEGVVNADDFAQAEIANRMVTVSITLARDRVEEFSGKVVFVEPAVRAGRTYRIWAEVENRLENGHWLLLPGHEPRMTVLTAVAAESRDTSLGRREPPTDDRR